MMEHFRKLTVLFVSYIRWDQFRTSSFRGIVATYSRIWTIS